MSVNRNPESKQAQVQREYRLRKLNKLIEDEMDRNKKLTKEQAVKIVKDKLKKKNSESRQALRMKNKGAKIVKEPEEDERKEQYITEPVAPLTTDEIKRIKGPLQVEEKIELNDDKVFNKLSYAEQKLVNRMSKINKSSVRSLVQYLQKVKQVYKKAGKVFNGTNIGLLKDRKELLEILKNYSNPKDHLFGIINVLKTFPQTESLVEYYGKIMKRFIDKNTRDIRENKKTQKQEANWINYPKLVDMFRKNKDKLDKMDRLLMSLIIFFPRRLDWRLMRLHKTGKKDMNYNYLNVNRYGIPSSFQFFRSKSQGYEDTTKKIPSSLKNIIMTSLREVKNNTLLFPRKDGSVHTADSFSRKIRDLFGIITGKRITMNLYRHIVATNLEDKGYSMNKRQETAEQMGHSLLKQMEYAKRN